MKTATLIICFATLLSTVVCGEVSVLLTEHTDMDGMRYVYHVSRREIDNAPSWSDLAKDPPLSVVNAVDAALLSVRQSNPNCEVLNIEQIALRRIYYSEIRDRWYYYVRINCRNKEQSQPRKDFVIVLLMDKTIVHPVIFRREKKN